MGSKRGSRSTWIVRASSATTDVTTTDGTERGSFEKACSSTTSIRHSEMARPGYADRNSLAVWARTREAQSELPRLVRRLILETCQGLVELGMPAGDGVAAGGWDGSVRATAGNAWVPEGLSVWELSVEASPGTKADADYIKRLDTPDGSSTSECTYIELIVRPWAKRFDWARVRRAENKWKDVRAYGLDDVEAWLEAAPITWTWYSERLGLSPYGMRSAETWWDAWAGGTSPPFDAKLVLAGRDDAVLTLKNRLGRPGITTIGGASIEETCAFIAAMAVDAESRGDGWMLARLAFVSELSTWRLLLDSAQPLILVPLDVNFAREVAGGSSHIVLVPVADAGMADIDLPPLDAAGVAAALKVAHGLDERRADEAGRLARRSLTALRRHLANNPALHRPPWAQPPVPRPIRAALLAGSWTDQREGDHSALAQLAGLTYESFREEAIALANVSDPFILQVGATWHLVSAVDAWLLLVERITEDDLKRLETVVLAVLGEEDPALEVPHDERWWKATLEGKVRVFSADLRRGLARTLALLGVHGEVVTLSSGGSGSGWANYLVRLLLQSANADSTGRRWASISDVLPLLAEAGPDAFIDAATSAVSGDAPLLASLFADQAFDGPFSANSPHTGLLWALEAVAWSPGHFGAAVDLLARLDEIDPGGRLANRPFASLAGIFRPWHPENSANPDRQLKVVDGLRRRHNEGAWKLLLSMLPEFNGFHSPTYEPAFRDWKPQRVPMTNAEYRSTISAVVARCIEEAKTDVGRWDGLMKRYSDLPPNDQVSIVAAFARFVEAGDLTEDDSDVLWASLREVVERNREYPDADWALPESALAPLDDLITRLQPNRSFQRHQWLFQDHMPHLAGLSRRDDHEAYEAVLAERRRDAVREIEQEGGLDAVLALAQAATVSWSVGIALAQAQPNHDNVLLDSLDTGDRAQVELASQYYFERFRREGRQWLGALLEQSSGRTALEKARLLLATRDVPWAWEVAEGLGPEVTEKYWQFFSPFGLGHEFEHVELVAEQLHMVGRNAMAIDFLMIYQGGAGMSDGRLAELTAQALEGLIASSDAEIRALSSYDFQHAFALLEAHREDLGVNRVATLEWAFLPALGHDPNVPALHQGMAESPEFFVEVVCAAYRQRGADATDTGDAQSDEQRAARARNGYNLLSSWGHPPGLSSGQVDSSRLREWLDEAKRLLEQRGRLEVGLVHFGHVLAKAPPDADGRWPSVVVRDLLEELHSEEVESGLATEILNSRGVTSRGLEDGGAREVELAQRYRRDADQLADEWPRAAALLRNVAKFYEVDARRNEESAERFRRGLE